MGHPVALDEDDVLEGVRVLLPQAVARGLDAAVDHVVEGEVLTGQDLEEDRLPVPVGPALRDEPPGVLAVKVEALGLPVGAIVPAPVGPLVPVQAQPVHARHDGLLVGRGRPCPVGVLDAQDEPPAGVPGPEPVEEGGVPAPDVKRPRGARGEAHPYFLFLFTILCSHCRSHERLSSTPIFCDSYDLLPRKRLGGNAIA